MRTITMTRLNQSTAEVLDALEQGESFQLVRKGRTVGYLTPSLPVALPARADRMADWEEHFAWVRRRPPIAPTAGDRSAEAAER